MENYVPTMIIFKNFRGGPQTCPRPQFKNNMSPCRWMATSTPENKFAFCTEKAGGGQCRRKGRRITDAHSIRQTVASLAALLYRASVAFDMPVMVATWL